MWRTESFEKTLILGKIEGGRRRGRQKMRWLDAFTNSIIMSLSKLQEFIIFREAWCPAVHGVTKNLTWLTHWTELAMVKNKYFLLEYKQSAWVWMKYKCRSWILLGKNSKTLTLNYLTICWLLDCIQTQYGWRSITVTHSGPVCYQHFHSHC